MNRKQTKTNLGWWMVLGIALLAWAPEATAQTAPVADAGGPYVVSTGQSLQLDGTGSYDPDPGDSIVSYEWDLNNDFVFSDASGATPSVTWAQLLALGLSAPYTGTIRLRVSDTWGMMNIDTASLQMVVDTTPPTATLSSAASDPTNANPIPVTVTFSEDVTGFGASDVTTTNGSVANFAGSGASYTFDLVPASDGVVTAEIAAGVCTDLAGNPNLGVGYAFALKWGTGGSGDGQFSFPHGLCVDSAGNVYITDRYNQRVQKFDANGTFLTKWGSSGSGDGQFNSPLGIAVDDTGNVYVADSSNHRVQKFDSNGVFLTKWGSSGSGDGQFAYPYGVAVDASGNVYVTCEGNHRVQKFTSTGTFVTKWGGNGSDDGAFVDPCGLEVDENGNVYVADRGNQRIQKFTSTGTFVAKWGDFGSGDGQFNNPFSVTCRNGRVFVADVSNYRVQVFTSNGAFVQKFGGGGGGDGQFDRPFDVAMSSNGTLYVADTYNNRSQKFSSSGPSLVRNFDETPPNPPSVTGATPTNDTTPTWTWTSGGGGNGTFRYDLDTSGVWTETIDTSYTPGAPLSDGTHRLIVQERDAAGNWSVDSFFDIFIDATPPAPPVVTGTTPTNDTTPTWSWTPGGGGNGTFRYDVASMGWGWIETTDTSFTPAAPFGEVTRTIYVQERDDAGNWSTSSVYSITIDLTPPAVSIGAPSASITSAGPVSYTITYTGADTVTLAPGDVMLNVTGDATGDVTVEGSGALSRTVVISNITGNGTLGISIVEDTASDAAGNSADAAGPSATFQVDNTSLGVVIGAPSAVMTKGDAVSYTVTYNNATTVTLDAADVTVIATGTASATAAVSGGSKAESTQQRTVTLENIAGDGTLAIAIAAGTAIDDLGLSAPAAGPSAAVTVDTTAPSVESIAVMATKGAMQDFLVTFSEPVGGVDISDFALTTTGDITDGDVVDVTGTAYTATYVVTVDTGTGAGTIRLDVIDNDTIFDEAGNPLGGPGANNGDFTAGEVFSNEPAALDALGVYALALLVLAIIVLFARRRDVRHN